LHWVLAIKGEPGGVHGGKKKKWKTFTKKEGKWKGREDIRRGLPTRSRQQVASTMRLNPHPLEAEGWRTDIENVFLFSSQGKVEDGGAALRKGKDTKGRHSEGRGKRSPARRATRQL